MTVDGILPTFLIGCLGGSLAEIARLYQLRDSPNLPNYIKHWFYWIATVLMILSGGVLAILYGVDKKNALLIANIGLSAPLIIKTSLGTVPPQVKEKLSGKTSEAQRLETSSVGTSFQKSLPKVSLKAKAKRPPITLGSVVSFLAGY